MGDTRTVSATEYVVCQGVALIHIRQLSGLDLGTETGYYDRKFSWFLLSPSNQMPR
jgi:hypothetical protein